MIRTFEALGHTGPKYTIGYYHDDANCNSSIDDHGDHSAHHGGGHVDGSHTADTPIEHLGYHLAWHIYDQHSRFGEPVDIVAHSMGGLMIRYAIAQTEHHEPGFPPYLLVEDVVTLGTPHGGARLAGLCRGPLVPGMCTPQAREMRAGSAFLKWLEENAWAPQGIGGTDWTTMGSDDDNTVAADRAAATDRDRDPVDKYMHSSHKVWYTKADNIEHNDFRDDDRDDQTADVYISDDGTPFMHFFDKEYPVRRAELAITYGDF
jgi:triacylglycerol esterase/lipase EstA (alpha/beta hydrolase family)